MISPGLDRLNVDLDLDLDLHVDLDGDGNVDLAATVRGACTSTSRHASRPRAQLHLPSAAPCSVAGNSVLHAALRACQQSSQESG